MTLPPKALNALINIKKELLSREPIPALEPPVRKETKGPIMRHARTKGRAFSKYQSSLNLRLSRM